MHVGGAVLSGERGYRFAEVGPVVVGVRIFGVLVVVVGGEADTDARGADGGGHGADYLEGESDALLDAAAVVVGARVDVVVEELV